MSNPRDELLQRHHRAISVAFPGSLSGRVRSAAPVEDDGLRAERVGSDDGSGAAREGVWILGFRDGPPLVASQLRPAHEHNGPDIVLSYLYAKLDPAATAGTTTFELFLNGSASAFATLSIAAGATEGTTVLSQAITAGDEIVLVSSPVGTGIDYASVQIGYEA